jgi:hypothetical protein
METGFVSFSFIVIRTHKRNKKWETKLKLFLLPRTPHSVEQLEGIFVCTSTHRRVYLLFHVFYMIQGHHEIAGRSSQCIPLPEGLVIPDAFTCKVPKAFTMQKELACM